MRERFSTQKPTKKRYFFVAFSGEECSGDMAFSSNGFPSRKELSEAIAKNISKKHMRNIEPCNIVINCLSEMSEADYQNWTK